MAEKYSTLKIPSLYKFTSEIDYLNFLATKPAADRESVLAFVGNSAGRDDVDDNTSQGFDIFLGNESLTKVKFYVTDESTGYWRLATESELDGTVNYAITKVDRDRQSHSKNIYLRKISEEVNGLVEKAVDDKYYSMLHHTHLIFRKIYSILYKFVIPNIDDAWLTQAPGIYEHGQKVTISSVRIGTLTEPDVKIKRIGVFKNRVQDVSPANCIAYTTQKTTGNELALNMPVTISENHTYYIGFTYEFVNHTDLIHKERNFDTSVPLGEEEGTEFVEFIKTCTYTFGYMEKFFWSTNIDAVRNRSIGEIMTTEEDWRPGTSYVGVTHHTGSLAAWVPTTEQTKKFLFACFPESWGKPKYMIDGLTYEFEEDKLINKTEYNGVTYCLYASDYPIVANAISITR